MFVPLVKMCEQMLDDAAAAGQTRPGLCHRRVAGFRLHGVMFTAFVRTISRSRRLAGSDSTPEDTWDMILRGLQVTGTTA